MNNSVKVVICSSNFRTYHDDNVVWDQDSRYTIRMHGQEKGHSEDILDQFIDPQVDHMNLGLFVHSGAHTTPAGNGMVMEPGFIGKIEEAALIAKRGYPGQYSVYSLTVQEIEKDMHVVTPTQEMEKCWKKWEKLCRGLGVSYDKVEIAEGSVNHGIFAVRTAELQTIADRLTR